RKTANCRPSMCRFWTRWGWSCLAAAWEMSYVVTIAAAIGWHRFCISRSGTAPGISNRSGRGTAHVGRPANADESTRVTQAEQTDASSSQSEASAALDERWFRAVADYTTDWESWHAADGRLVWVNPAVERLTGYSVAECL